MVMCLGTGSGPVLACGPHGGRAAPRPHDRRRGTAGGGSSYFGDAWGRATAGARVRRWVVHRDVRQIIRSGHRRVVARSHADIVGRHGYDPERPEDRPRAALITWAPVASRHGSIHSFEVRSEGAVTSEATKQERSRGGMIMREIGKEEVVVSSSPTRDCPWRLCSSPSTFWRCKRMNECSGARCPHPSGKARGQTVF
jgi:hypothetical protein